MTALKTSMNIISEILDINQDLIGEDYLKKFIQNVAKNLNVKYVLIGHPTSDALTEIQTDIVWAADQFIENFTYDLKDTPCEIVLSGERVCIHDSNVCIDFPDDQLLQEMNIEAYVGAPVLSKNNKNVSSILVLLDDKPMKDKEFFSVTTEFLALRVSAEIDKLHAISELEYSNEMITKLYENSPIGMVMIDQETGMFLKANKSLLQSTQYTEKEFLNLSIWDVTPKKYKVQQIQKFEELKKKGSFSPYEKEFIRKDGSLYPIKVSAFVVENVKNNHVVWGLIEDITELKQSEIIYKDNKELLEYIAIENDLQKTLDKITSLFEKRNVNAQCSILLLNESKTRLLSGSAPSLPKYYTDAINGIAIGEKVGSCGSAAFKKERVIVENIDTHENWQGFLELTNRANLHSCWSEPFISSNNEVLGTFAIYSSEHKKPTTFELKQIENYGNLASKAIEKHNYTQLIKLNEQKLKNKQILLKNILSTIPDMLWLKDENGAYLVCNSEFEKFFGKSEQEIIGKNDYDFLDKELADFFRIHDKNAMESNSALVNEEWLTYATNNKKVLLETTKKAMINDNGKIIGVLGIGHNITQRKIEEDKLRELNALAKSLTKSQEVLLSLFDKGESILFKRKNNMNMMIEYVSKSVTDFMGYTEEDFLKGKISYTDCIHPDDINRVKEEVNISLSNNLDYFKHKPYRIITKDGSEKWVMDHTATQKDIDGNITHFIGYITDITEQIKNQEIMFHQSKIASLGEMLGNIAHQWRQPLSVISTGATGMKLQKEYDSLSDEMFNKTCDMINDNAQYLSKTIDDFRNFFLSDTSNETTVNIPNLIDKVIALIQDSFKSSNIIIMKDYKVTSLLLNCNENLLLQALINIFNNAKDALNDINEKNFQKYVFINLEEKDDVIIINIKDNAHGIPLNIIDSIFDPYFTTKEKTQGTGIGLYMTNQIITKHLKSEIIAENTKYIYEDKSYEGASFNLILNNKL